MRLLAVHVENFMGLLGVHSVSLDELGLVHVGGVNADDPGNNSNGAGKTTLLEAVTWCLFGEGLPRPQGNSEQGVRADEVLSSSLKKQCRVVVELVDDSGVPIRVERWRKWKPDGSARKKGVRASNGQLLSVDGEIFEGLDEKETNARICERIGITREIWSRGVVFGQESSFNFCDATSKARQEILSVVMGLGEIDTWLSRCRDDKRALTTKMAGVNGKLQILRSERDRLASEDIESMISSWESDRAVRLEALKKELSHVESVGKALKLELEGAPQAPEDPGQLPPFSWVESGLQAAMDLLSKKTGEIASLKRDLRAAREEARSISELHVGAQCPTCRQVISGDHVQACLAQVDSSVGRLEASLSTAVAEEAQLRQVVSSEEADRAQAYRAWEAERSRRSQIEKERHDLLRYRDQISQRIEGARAKWVEVSRQIKSVESEVNPHEAYRDELRKKIDRNAEELREEEAELSRIGVDLEIAQWWERELPRFRTWLFDGIVDTLAGEANRWLRIMSGGAIWIEIKTTKLVGKKLKDDLDVQIHRWNPDGTTTTRPYRVWSGGEKRRVALSVDLGLSHLLAQRAGAAYHFLALDEIDRHLDDRGKEGLRAVLDELKDGRETILTVTHDPEFRASFDSEILVERRGGAVSVQTVRR